ncbi:restriction endonuclease subunit S [Mucilaginibacter limnophilus]|uniref:Restriction endonuclease subunit S n=1 Tax=Mucilaginibacter limnophilus TaxID=1932778 RepID=A0A3S2UN78_9SPHI|nr:restriction endonuclease subunit S [Mucilaginibacter limnophilus]RVU02565.1 restriction endonuclease subunit S [Mucilaginibacter limnophilus]
MVDRSYVISNRSPRFRQNWKLVKLKNVSQVLFSTVDRHEYESENSVSICHYPQAYKNEIICQSTILSTGTCTNNEKSQYSLERGRIILTKDSENPEDIGIATYINEDIPEAVCGYHLALIVPDEKLVDPQFLFWYLKSQEVRYYFTINANGVTRFGLSKSAIQNVVVPLPSLEEQKSLGIYLTEKIKNCDEILKSKEAIISLLREKKFSLITEAVTNGLNKNVLLKDSGQEWLGRIPNHWNLKKNKFLFKIKKNIARDLGHDVLSVTQKGIKIKDIDSNKGQISFDYSKYQLVEPGDFIMNHMDLLTGYIDISKWFGVTSPDYRVFHLTDHNSCNKYYLYLFQLCYVNRIFYGLGQGVSQLGRWRMRSHEFNDFTVPCPPLSEQAEIVEYLDNVTSNIDALIIQELATINLLNEYRTAIISESYSLND